MYNFSDHFCEPLFSERENRRTILVRVVCIYLDILTNTTSSTKTVYLYPPFGVLWVTRP